MRALLPLLILALVPACKAKPKSTCAAETLATVETALSQVKPERRAELAVAGLAEACPEPASFAKAMGDLRVIAPDQRAMVMAKAIQDNAGVWTAACKGGTKVFTALAQAAPDKRTALLWEGCGLDRFGFASQAEADGKPFLLVAVMYAQMLEDAGVEKARRLTLLRALLGL